jgi:hypothetical protein
VVTGSFEQSVRNFESDDLPRPETVGPNELKVPVVRCRFAVREATSLEHGDLADPAFSVVWRATGGRLVFDNGLSIACARPNLEIEASDDVVGWRRVRLGRWESDVPWEDD